MSREAEPVDNVPKPKAPEAPAHEPQAPVMAPPVSDAVFGTGLGAGMGAPTGVTFTRHLARRPAEERKTVVDDLNGRVGNRRVARMLRADGRALRSHLPRPDVGHDTEPVHIAHAAAVRATGPVISRFEAGHHERVERGSLTAGPGGFSDAEASAVYFGNWSRDLSQALLNHPIINSLGQEVVFEILNLMAMQKFGRELDPKDFGVYSPREHIDNPAGQTTSDLNQPGTPGAGPHTLAHGEDISSPDAISKLFTVNDAGLPAYLGRSIQYVEEELSIAADRGRTSEGLMHMGNGLHTVEDLFAHSNFIEMAVGKLLREGQITVSGELQEDLDQRAAQGLDPVETLSGRTEGGRPILTTGSYVASDTLVSLGEAMATFFEEFDPFGAANKERSQALVERLLTRYEDTGRAGEMLSSMLRSMAENIPTKLREWITSKIEQAEPDDPSSMSWSDRLVFEGRQAAAGVAGRALDAVSSLAGNEWVQQRLAGAANAAASLPWTEIYRFAIEKRNQIEDALKQLDADLLASPISSWAYKPFRAWIKEQLQTLREKAKEAIKTALKAAADIIKKGFGESVAETSNIHDQIEDAVQNQIKNAEARAEYRGASNEEKARMLSDPQWCGRARITEGDAEHLRAMIMLPEWAQAGPSHSQIAKDHADSPFFGLAATLAGHADQRLRDLLVAVWTAEGRNEHRRDEAHLAENYGGEIPEDIRRQLDDPNLDPRRRTELERDAQKAAPHYNEIKRRQEGEALLATGAIPEAEEDHPGDDALEAAIHRLHDLARLAGELPDDLRRLADRVETAAPDAAAELRAVATALPAGVDELAEQAEHASDAEAMRRVAERLRALAREKDGLVARAQRAVESAAAAVESAQPAGDALADELRAAARQVRSVAPRISRSLVAAAEAIAAASDQQSVTDAQMRRARDARAPAEAWAPELAASHARGGTQERDALFTFVRMLFSHPFDSSWWIAPTITWATLPGNQERLEAYIKVRNSGRIHHHH